VAAQAHLELGQTAQQIQVAVAVDHQTLLAAQVVQELLL
jgi:hypothetical protein